jgi:hypothetical protein
VIVDDEDFSAHELDRGPGIVSTRPRLRKRGPADQTLDAPLQRGYLPLGEQLAKLSSVRICARRQLVLQPHQVVHKRLGQALAGELPDYGA